MAGGDWLRLSFFSFSVPAFPNPYSFCGLEFATYALTNFWIGRLRFPTSVVSSPPGLFFPTGGFRGPVPEPPWSPWAVPPVFFFLFSLTKGKPVLYYDRGLPAPVPLLFEFRFIASFAQHLR